MAMVDGETKSLNYIHHHTQEGALEPFNVNETVSTGKPPFGFGFGGEGEGEQQHGEAGGDRGEHGDGDGDGHGHTVCDDCLLCLYVYIVFCCL